MRRRKAEGRTEAAPDIEDVRRQRSECAERLKRYTIWKRLADRICRPIYAERRSNPSIEEECNVEARAKAELDMMHDLLHNRCQIMKESINAITDDVEQRWATEKMNIVPCSELLDCWYRRHGYRFLKMRDSPVLASLMQRDEIEREIVSLIEEIGSSI